MAEEWKIRLASRKRELKPPQRDIEKLSSSEEALVPYNDEKDRRRKGPSLQ